MRKARAAFSRSEDSFLPRRLTVVPRISPPLFLYWRYDVMINTRVKFKDTRRSLRLESRRSSPPEERKEGERGQGGKAHFRLSQRGALFARDVAGKTAKE